MTKNYAATVGLVCQCKQSDSQNTYVGYLYGSVLIIVSCFVNLEKDYVLILQFTCILV